MRVEFDPKKCDVLLYQLAGYAFIRKWLTLSDNVLEIGCGEGHTAYFLASKCATFHAIDSDKELQERNKKTYGERLARFFTCSWQDWNAMDRYDAVVCRDLIEHQTKEETIQLLDKIVDNYLGDGTSILFLGTPKEGIVPNRPDCQGHVHEWNNVELQHLLERYFERVMFFSQTDEVVSLIEVPRLAWRWIIVCIGPKKRESL